jgi:hypothetical protein
MLFAHLKRMPLKTARPDVGLGAAARVYALVRRPLSAIEKRDELAAFIKNPPRTTAVALRPLLLWLEWSMEQIPRGRSDPRDLPRQVADIEIGAFLIAAGKGPEKQELLRLIGSLV